MTIVVVGGGPTGVELAGAFAELTRTVLNRDFRRIDPTHARIILIEGSPVILSHLPADLPPARSASLSSRRASPEQHSRKRHPRRRSGTRERGNHSRRQHHLGGRRLRFTADEKLGVELDKAGRVKVNPDLSLPGTRKFLPSATWRWCWRRTANRSPAFHRRDADGKTRRKDD